MHCTQSHSLGLALLWARCDGAAVEEAGFTPLLLAAREGHVAAVDALMQSGTDLRATTASRP